MFVPLHDGVPIRFVRAPYVTYVLIALCVGLHLTLALNASEEARLAIMAGFGMIPSVLLGPDHLAPELPQLPAWATLVSNTLLHASFAHLVGNMLFLWVFGDNVEDAMGHWRFLAFFVLCGLAGSLAHAFVNPASQNPLIGASGSLSGVIAAYLMLHPQVRIWGLAFKWLPLRIPALYALGTWILFQLVSALTSGEAEIGWWAHLGGLAAGAALTPLMIHRGIPLFGRIAGA